MIESFMFHTTVNLRKFSNRNDQIPVTRYRWGIFHGHHHLGGESGERREGERHPLFRYIKSDDMVLRGGL